MSETPYAHLLQKWPSAEGPGVFSDQASSFLPAMVSDLRRGVDRQAIVAAGPTLTSLFREEYGRSPQSHTLVRVRNPPEGKADDVDAVMDTDDLTQIAVLVTGVWGPGLMPIRHAPNMRGSLPVIQNGEESSVPGRHEPFWPRMERLQRLLGGFRASLPGKYVEVYGTEARKLLRRAKAASASDRAKLTAELRAIGYNIRGELRYAPTRQQPWIEMVARFAKAVDFVLSQRGRRRPSILGENGAPFGFKPSELWGVIAAKGNKKLPFAAYSELPMATCLGAGACGVPFYPRAREHKKANGGGWCYSFKAWRYPNAFLRQALNTLANTADREFAIEMGSIGSTVTDLRRDYDARVQAALRGREHRVWPGLVRDLVLEATAEPRAAGKVSYLRLFVDGDLGFEDQIFEWMEVCRQLGPDSAKRSPGEGFVEVYGYSKLWAQLCSVDAEMRPHLTRAQRESPSYRDDRGRWPANYTLNLSSGSVHSGTGTASIRAHAEVLPITRGYFEAIDLQQFLKELATADAGKVSVPDWKDTPFRFNESRIKDFITLNNIGRREDGTAATETEMLDKAAYVLAKRGGLPPMTLRMTSDQVADFLHRNGLRVPGIQGRLDQKKAWTLAAEAISTELGRSTRVIILRPTPKSPSPKAPPTDQQIRRQVYHAFLNDLLTDQNFAALVADEIHKDSSELNEARYLEIAARASWKRTHKVLSVPGKFRSPELDQMTDKALHDKALALVLHEVMWSLGIGGSCPLICSNCSDSVRPTLDSPGKHRCASKTNFRDKNIKIGLH